MHSNNMLSKLIEWKFENRIIELTTKKWPSLVWKMEDTSTLCFSIVFRWWVQWFNDQPLPPPGQPLWWHPWWPARLSILASRRRSTTADPWTPAVSAPTPPEATSSPSHFFHFLIHCISTKKESFLHVLTKNMGKGKILMEIEQILEQYCVRDHD
jgi:hypothetical protein